MRALLINLLLLPAVSAGSLVASLSGALKSSGDAPVVTIACCGASRSSPSVVGEAVGASGSGPVSVVPAPTPLALLDVAADQPDGTTAFAAADVVALEVKFLDLVERSAHGLGQLLPLLQKSVRLRDLRPQPKLLLLTVTDFDPSDVSEAEVSAFAEAQLAELVTHLSLPSDEAELSVADLLQLQCVFLPSKRGAPDAYAKALGSLNQALTSAGAPGYLFEGRLSAPASAVVQCVGQAAERAGASASAASPAEVHAAYQCGLLAEAAAREFQKGATALRKAADSSLLSDFGERATALVDDAISRFDSESTSFKGSAPVAAARGALAEQLQRALYNPFRKQLAALTRQTLTKYRAKVQATKPSAEIAEQLQSLTEEATAAFDASAKGLLPSGVRWTYSYERSSIVEAMAEVSEAHIQQLQVQGLYLAKTGHRVPVDVSVHTLRMHPFGRDSRYDPLRPDDAPAYKPQASVMKMRAEGYKPRTKLKDPDLDAADPRRMVFTDKMMQ